MDCKITGEPVANVSTEAKSVIGSRCRWEGEQSIRC